MKKFAIQTRTANGNWVTAADGTVDAGGVIHTFKATAGKKDVRYVRFIMKSNHGDPLLMGVLEVTVRST